MRLSSNHTNTLFSESQNIGDAIWIVRKLFLICFQFLLHPCNMPGIAPGTGVIQECTISVLNSRHSLLIKEIARYHSRPSEVLRSLLKVFNQILRDGQWCLTVEERSSLWKGRTRWEHLTTLSHHHISAIRKDFMLRSLEVLNICSCLFHFLKPLLFELMW